MLRALIVIRLSRVTDNTTSPERQLDVCRQLIEQRGYTEIGIAQDLDLSGSVDPFTRPSLGSWLADRHNEFDTVVCYRVDRLTRSIRHLRQLVDWAEDNNILVVSATEPHFDMSSPFAAVLIALLGTVAQMELEAISERSASAARHNIKAGKYRGGTPPWGYLPKQDDTGTWRLVQDPVQVETINEVVRRVLDGEPLNRIAHDLTRRGILTVKDRIAQTQGREAEGFEWTVNQLKRSLLSSAMLGHAVSGGATVRNDDGSAVVRAKPILSREVFDRLTVELAGRSKRGEPTKRSTSLLLRVLYCGICRRPAYRFNGGSRSEIPRYRCSSATKHAKCGNRILQLDTIDNGVESIILGMLGTSEHLERVWDSGSDHSTELTEINDTLTDLTGLLGSGPYRAGTPQRIRLDERIKELAARQAALSAETVKQAGWTLRPTGEKFADWWNRQDTTARNVWLRSYNIRVDFDREQIRLDLGDISRLTEQLDPSGPVAGWQSVLNKMSEVDVQGLTVAADGEVIFHHKDGRTVSLAEVEATSF
jgi:site-specific DNA recombinase